MSGRECSDRLLERGAILSRQSWFEALAAVTGAVRWKAINRKLTPLKTRLNYSKESTAEIGMEHYLDYIKQKLKQEYGSPDGPSATTKLLGSTSRCTWYVCTKSLRGLCLKHCCKPIHKQHPRRRNTTETYPSITFVRVVVMTSMYWVH